MHNSRTTLGDRAVGRRRMLELAALAAAVPAAGTLLGGSPAAAAAGSESLPDYAPIPAASLGPALNADGYFVGRIKGNLYWVTEGVYQMMFLSTRTGVVLVDAPPTLGHNLFRAIDEVTRANGRPSKVTHLIYSHSHADHISGAALFDSSVVRISHSETRRLLQFDNDSNRPLPQVTFDDHYTLEVGGERLELRYHGTNHSPDNIFIYAPAYKTLMAVDILFPGWTPFFNLAIASDIPGWFRAHDIAMGYPWTTYVGGHMGRLGIRADGELQRQYIHDLEASARKALAEVDITPYYSKYVVGGGNTWALVREYFGAIARVAAAPVIQAYAGRLAAVDVLTESHALVLIESLRVNNGLIAIT